MDAFPGRSWPPPEMDEEDVVDMGPLASVWVICRAFVLRTVRKDGVVLEGPIVGGKLNG